MAAVAQRARAAVVGNLVGDAAAVCNHWVYDPEKMAEAVKNAKRGPAFCDPPANGFYTTPPGGFSCYGDQTMCLLESLAECRKFDAEDYSARLAERFGKTSPYDGDAVDPENWPDLKKNPTDADGKVIESERLWTMPLPIPWRHGSVKGFLKKYTNEGRRFPDCGSDDEQVDGCCKVPPIVALYAGHPSLLATVDAAVRVTQNTDKAAGYACGFALVLEALILERATTVVEACSQAAAAVRSQRELPVPLNADVAAQLERMGTFAGKPSGDVGMALKPEGAGFAFAGLS
mmetsp:Transcript_6446/g.13885  ORF Transcript_6446/g.13885 Transcript_6446/m.13885 type:complete len:289 (-) Transcript_6446:176-1042(-)